MAILRFFNPISILIVYCKIGLTGLAQAGAVLDFSL